MTKKDLWTGTEARSLVSIIIPCFNAESWVSETIDSCLQQTYSPIEVIIVDDGSTDNSLNVLKKYGELVTVARCPNRGGSAARNLGFALSKGEYIQFLDADDYILPDKIYRQVSFLQETKADAVYGDWRHQYHMPDGSAFLQDVTISGAKIDILETILEGWWIPCHALLYKREIIIACNGWDESLQAGQDKAFLLSCVLQGAHILYQSGCYSIYRRYGHTTVSTSSKQRFFSNHFILLEKAEAILKTRNTLNYTYRIALAKSYFYVARSCYIDENTRELSLNALKKVYELNPMYKPHDTSWAFTFVYNLFGFKAAQMQMVLSQLAMEYIRKSISAFIRRVVGDHRTKILVSLYRRRRFQFKL